MWRPFQPRALPPGVEERLPPNQRLTDGFPILHEGTPPALSEADFTLAVTGLVQAPRTFTWDELAALPRVKLVNDFHCVTGWSKLDNVWEGVRFLDLARHLAIEPAAMFVAVTGHLGDDPAGYMANVPLETLMGPDVLLATAHNGRPLTRDHGGPLRLVVPRRYGWKSVKWLRGFDFRAEDAPGYWEQRGYHMRAEPFAEERFATTEKPTQRMKVRGKDHS